MADSGSGCRLRAHRLGKVYGARPEMVRASDGGDLLPMPGRAADPAGRPAVRAVDAVDLDIWAGEMVAVMGPSGCGKSSLLHLFGGLERPTSGQVWLNGERIDELSEGDLARVRRTSLGFVFQSFHLLDELSVARNVEIPALLAGCGPREARRRASWLLERVGLADRTRHRISELSGGQRQRVAIARALSNAPAVVLADEPTGSLDSAATLEVLRIFAGLAAAGQAVVVVTHDERVGAAADRVIRMRDGRAEPWAGSC